jgi:hypothetical protein
MSLYYALETTKMSEAKAALMHARRLVRGGKRYLLEGHSAEGIAALYDALLFGMRHFIAEAVRHKRIDITNNDDLWDCAALYYKLAQAGIFDDPCAFNRLSLIVERALWQETFSFDAYAVLLEVEQMLTNLGVMHFDEDILPGKSRTVR